MLLTTKTGDHDIEYQGQIYTSFASSGVPHIFFPGLTLIRNIFGLLAKRGVNKAAYRPSFFFFFFFCTLKDTHTEMTKERGQLYYFPAGYSARFGSLCPFWGACDILINNSNHSKLPFTQLSTFLGSEGGLE